MKPIGNHTPPRRDQAAWAAVGEHLGRAVVATVALGTAEPGGRHHDIALVLMALLRGVSEGGERAMLRRMVGAIEPVRKR